MSRRVPGGETRRRPSFSGSWFAAMAAALLVLMVSMCCVAPVVALAVVSSERPTMGDDAAAAASAAPSWRLAASSLAAATGVGAMAVVLGLPAAACLRRMRTRAALLLVPVMLPAYLAYSGWNVLRGPVTPTGDMLASLGPDVSIWIGRILGVLGVALWSSPLAALVLADGFARIPAGAGDALRLESGPWAGRVMSRVRLVVWSCSGSIVLAGLIPAALALGSPVPLHLAQIETPALSLWLALDLTPRDRWGSMLATSWWTVVPALAACAAIGWRLISRQPRGEADSEPRDVRAGAGPSVWVHAAAWCVWALATIVPAALTALSVRDRAAFARFWTDDALALRDSGLVALAAGAVAMLLCVSAWAAWSESSTPSRAGWRIASLAVRLAVCVCGTVLVLTAFIPGVVIGAAWAAAWARLGEITDALPGVTPLVAAHVARFGAVGVILGIAAARTEPRSLRDLRRLDAQSPAAWVRSGLRARWIIVPAAGLCVAGMSLQEIEASVMVVPPGHRSLPQTMLEKLHYLRDEELAAGLLTMLAVGASIAALPALALPRSLRTQATQPKRPS